MKFWHGFSSLITQPSRLMLNRHYRGKKVLVIGGAGFVGWPLVEFLVEVGAETYVLDDFSRGRNLVTGARYFVHVPFSRSIDAELILSLDAGTVSRIIGQGRLGIGIDAGDPASVAVVLRKLNPDYIFNLAASVAGVLHNRSHHLQMYSDNIRLLTAPLSAIEMTGVVPQKYLQTSSVCVYAEEYQNPCVEINGMRSVPHPANAGYAEAKRDGERVMGWSNLPHWVVVRPSNVIGQGDYYDERAHVVPAFIHRAATIADDEIFVAYGRAAVVREFIHSSDVATGMLYALARGESGEAYNIGTNGETTSTMVSLAERIVSRVDYRLGRPRGRRVMFKSEFGGGDSYRQSDSTKLMTTGWKPSVSLPDAVGFAISDYFTRGLFSR